MNPKTEMGNQIEKTGRAPIVVGRVTPCAPRLQPTYANFPRRHLLVVAAGRATPGPQPEMTSRCRQPLRRFVHRKTMAVHPRADPNAKGVPSFSPGLRASATLGTPPRSHNPERVAPVRIPPAVLHLPWDFAKSGLPGRHMIAQGNALGLMP